VHELTARITQIQALAQAKTYERNQLSLVVAAIEQELNKRQAALDDTSRQRYEFDREMAIARDQLGQLERERQIAETATKPETIEIENHPTPIGKIVDGDESYVQFSHGRVVIVPAKQLLIEWRGVGRSQVSKMGTQSERIELVGPIEGFYMRYLIQRIDGPSGSMYGLGYWELLPESTQLGETVEEALRVGSSFRRALEEISPSLYTITLCIYPDSFADLPRLKKELYALGYNVAVHPMFKGQPIAFGPDGVKSVAQ
jgi:hypothetical protein